MLGLPKLLIGHDPQEQVVHLLQVLVQLLLLQGLPHQLLSDLPHYEVVCLAGEDDCLARPAEAPGQP